VVDRIAAKIQSAADHVPAPEVHVGEGGARAGIVSIGGYHRAVMEARDELLRDGLDVDYLRVRGFPFNETVTHFLEEHETVFVVEQNRDGQLRTLLSSETGCPKAKLVSVRDYGGQPLSKGHVLDGVRPVLDNAAVEATS
jgi:2-oxoglutarate ferredoxin oxidoreductase subunit alpha